MADDGDMRIRCRERVFPGEGGDPVPVPSLPYYRAQGIRFALPDLQYTRKFDLDNQQPLVRYSGIHDHGSKLACFLIRFFGLPRVTNAGDQPFAGSLRGGMGLDAESAKMLKGIWIKLRDRRFGRKRSSSVADSVPEIPSEAPVIISTLLAMDILTWDSYLDLWDSYIARNLYLYIFEISAPRSFGEAWAQGHLKELIPELDKPTRKADPDYSGQYDFLLDGKVRIEVKASRAVDKDSDEPLYVKALASDSKSPFWMNFQQIKPGCCDVFVWVAVWRDRIRYWVLSSQEVESHPSYSQGQHRGNVGEGQLHVREDNINVFAGFEVLPTDLAAAIRSTYIRQTGS